MFILENYTDVELMKMIPISAVLIMSMKNKYEKILFFCLLFSITTSLYFHKHVIKHKGFINWIYLIHYFLNNFLINNFDQIIKSDFICLLT